MNLRKTPTLLLAGLLLILLVTFTACIAPIQAPLQIDSTSATTESTEAATTSLSSVTVIGGDEADLRNFLEQWIVPYYPGAPATQITITVGYLPAALPVALSLPPTLTVLGAIAVTGDYTSTELLLTAPQDGETTVTTLHKELEAQGFTLPDDTMGAPTRGFQSNEPLFTVLCDSAHNITANLSVSEGQAGVSNIRLSLSLEQPYGPCSEPQMGMGSGELKILPVLKAPANVTIRSQGTSSGDDQADINAEIESAQELSVLVDHYTAQLEENGWQQLDASATEDIAWSAWTTTDDQDDIWNATFYILRQAAEEDSYLATLKLKRQR